MPANTRTEANAKPTLVFNTARFDEVWRLVYGPMKVREIAESLGIDYRQFSSIRTGDRKFGLAFVATVRSKLPTVPFDELFTVVPGESDAEAGDAA